MKNLISNRQVSQTEKTEVYEAPQIEVIDIEVEQGFQASGDSPSRPEGPSW